MAAKVDRRTREMPHSTWWTEFLKNKTEAGFWHETYSMRGGIEAIYDDMTAPIGMMKFAPLWSLGVGG